MALEKIKKKKNPEQNQKKTKNISSKAPLFAIMNHISDLFFSEVALRNPSINTKNI